MSSSDPMPPSTCPSSSQPVSRSFESPVEDGTIVSAPSQSSYVIVSEIMPGLEMNQPSILSSEVRNTSPPTSSQVTSPSGLHDVVNTHINNSPIPSFPLWPFHGHISNSPAFHGYDIPHECNKSSDRHFSFFIPQFPDQSLSCAAPYPSRCGSDFGNHWCATWTIKLFRGCCCSWSPYSGLVIQCPPFSFGCIKPELPCRPPGCTSN